MARQQYQQSVAVTGSNVSGATGAAVPSRAQLVGGTDGTNLRALYMRTSLAGSLNPQAAAEVTAYLMAQNADGTLSRVPFAYGDAFTGGVLATQEMGWNGANNLRKRIVDISKTLYAAAAGSGVNQATWTPAAGKKFRLHGIVLSCSVAGRVVLVDGAATFANFLLPANTPVVVAWPANGYISTTANNVLSVAQITGGAADVAAWAIGNEE